MRLAAGSARTDGGLALSRNLEDRVPRCASGGLDHEANASRWHSHCAPCRREWVFLTAVDVEHGPRRRRRDAHRCHLRRGCHLIAERLADRVPSALYGKARLRVDPGPVCHRRSDRIRSRRNGGSVRRRWFGVARASSQREGSKDPSQMRRCHRGRLRSLKVLFMHGAGRLDQVKVCDTSVRFHDIDGAGAKGQRCVLRDHTRNAKQPRASTPIPNRITRKSVVAKTKIQPRSATSAGTG
jgi:hypothetical protein